MQSNLSYISLKLELNTGVERCWATVVFVNIYVM